MAYARQGKIHFRNRFIFYIGFIAITMGVLVHLPWFFNAEEQGYKLANMQMGSTLTLSIVLIILGMVMATWGVIPKVIKFSENKCNSGLALLNDAPLNKAHWSLIFVITITLIIDIMKPATLAFVMPGMREEYGLSQAMVALLPLGALTGTAIGSFLWGRIGDWLGRRAAILLASLMFIGTSICGTMPTFNWNIALCFLMGISAGGLLPVAMTILAEFMPTRHRALFLVLIGGFGSIGGYLVASASAAILEPHFGWRILWLLGFPTGLIIILLNPFIPESPRFLMLRDRVEEAHSVLQNFDIKEYKIEKEQLSQQEQNLVTVRHLLQYPYLIQTVTIMLYGLAWGLVNYCFLLWLPSNLRHLGFNMGIAEEILAKSALFAIPAVVLVAWLYMKWSSKKTLVICSFLTGVALLGFIPIAEHVNHYVMPLSILLIILLAASTGMAASLLPYVTELYPTNVRATGVGFAAGSGKLGGVIGLVILAFNITPTLIVSSLLVVVPVFMAMLLFGLKSIETRGIVLDENPFEANKTYSN